MRLSDVRSIHDSEPCDANPELRFTHIVSCLDGTLTEANLQPDEWDHVRRLTNNLFLAWSAANPQEGSVYLGVFEEPQQEDICERIIRVANQFAINHRHNPNLLEINETDRRKLRAAMEHLDSPTTNLKGEPERYRGMYIAPYKKPGFAVSYHPAPKEVAEVIL